MQGYYFLKKKKSFKKNEIVYVTQGVFVIR